MATPPVVQSQYSYLSSLSGLLWHRNAPQEAPSSSPEHASQLRSLVPAAPVDSDLSDNECTVCRSAGEEINDAEVALKTPTEACTHPPQVCIGCLQQVILAAVTSGDFIVGIPCPSYDCAQRMGYHDVQKWAAKEVFDRYDKLLLQDSLRTDGRYVLCVEASCLAGQEHSGGDHNNIVTCYHCGTKQCFRHRIPWHEGLTCEQWDEQQRTITEQEQKTEDWIQVGTKACPGPGCGRRIQKTEGCDHLICKCPGGCGHQFCWECLAPWLQIISEDNSRHYDSCKYYSGLPGKNPAPPEIVAARTVLAPQLPSTPSNPALREARTSLFHRPQPLHEPVLAHLAQRRELLAGRIRATSRTAEVPIQASTPPTTLNATPSSSSTEPSGSSRMPIIPTISEPSSSSSLPTHNSNLISHGELRTVSQIRNAAAMKTNKSVKGAAPLTAMNSLRRLAEEAHCKEKAGDIRGALFRFVQVGVLLQFVQESHEYKQEAQKGRHGALYQLMQEFNRGPFEAMMKSVHNIQQTLLKVEQAEAERFSASSDIASTAYGESSNRRVGSIADRFRQRQGTSITRVYSQQNQGSSLENPRQGPTPVPNQRHHLNISFPIPLPASPSNGRQATNPTIDLPITSAIPVGTYPRQFVPYPSFGPPSPTHSTGSSSEEDDIQVPRVHRDPPIRVPFYQNFPLIDELNEPGPTSMFPAVSAYAAGASNSMASPNGAHPPRRPDRIPWRGKQFDIEPRPANAPAVDLPIASAITPQKLNSLLETRGLNILLFDVRSRKEFERERINHDAIVCLDPLILTRQGINSSMIEGAQVISPPTEQVLFKNRSRFDLVVMYDDSSTSLGHPTSPMSALLRSIFEREFHRPLRRPPMVLVGGLRAWKEVVGDQGIIKHLSHIP